MTREEMVNAIFNAEKTDLEKSDFSDPRSYNEKELYDSINKMEDDKIRLYYELFLA